MSKVHKQFITVNRTAFESVQWHPTYKTLIVEGLDESGNTRVHHQIIKFTCTMESDWALWAGELHSSIKQFIIDNCKDYDKEDIYDKIIDALFPIGE